VPERQEGNKIEKTSTGLQENVAGLLCYVGWWVSGLVFLLIEKDNQFVRFHAIQSIIVFAVVTVAYIVFSLIPFSFVFIPIVSVIAVILWVILMIKAYQGKLFKLPWAGEMAAKRVK